MGLDQDLYKVTSDELEKLRALLKESEDAIYHEPGLLAKWEARNEKDSYSWKNRWDISCTLCSHVFDPIYEYEDIYSFQKGFWYRETDEEDDTVIVNKEMPSLIGTGYYYVYIESY